jgi:Nucleotidyl transferase AbiEii toxin, Type IV TA system
MTLTPHFGILSTAQRRLWPALVEVPRQFVLYGGTAIALRLGHRASVDFDFFTNDPIDHHALEAMELVREAVTIQLGPSERTVIVERGDGPVKLSFFGALPFGRVGEPEETADGVLSIASLRDLAATKIKALLQRVEAKDYNDVAALLSSGLDLADILGAARALFGDVFNPLVAQKALVYFVGGDLETLDAPTRARLEHAALADLEVPVVKLVATHLVA